MSLGTANFCPAALFSLTMARINNPNNLMPQGGSLLALNSPENIAAGEMVRLVNDNGTGHIREVRTVYKPRRTKDQVTNTKDCEVGPYLGYIEDTFEPSNFSQISFSVPEDSVRRYCDSYCRLQKISGAEVPNPAVLIGNPAASNDLRVMEELANELMSQMNAMVQAINSEILTIADTYAGDWQGGSSTLAFPIQNADGSVNALGLQQFRQQLKKTKFTGIPQVITGFGALDRIAFNDNRYFCCAANGINFEVAVNQDQFRLYLDENVDEVLGSDDKALIFLPGSLIFTPVPQYVGNFGRIGVEERVRIPFMGIPNQKLDLRIQGIPCDNEYAMWLEMKWDLWGAPTNMFTDPDFQAGINGIFKATFTQS
jgi:hypothetical protein